MSKVQELEIKLDEIFNKNAPQLPAGWKRFIHKWAPWAALVVGILSLLSAYTLWNGARGGSPSSYYVQQVCSTYQSSNGHCSVPSVVSHLGFWLWLAIITTIIQGVLYLRAFPRLRLFQKSGWDFVYYAALVNVAYAIVTLLTGYDVIGHFIGSLIGLALSFYVLFQVRPLYLSAPVTDTDVDEYTYLAASTTPLESRHDEADQADTPPAEATVASPAMTARAKATKRTVAAKTTKPKPTKRKTPAKKKSTSKKA